MNRGQQRHIFFLKIGPTDVSQADVAKGELRDGRITNRCYGSSQLSHFRLCESLGFRAID